VGGIVKLLQIVRRSVREVHEILAYRSAFFPAPRPRRTVFVKELSERDRTRMLNHFVTLVGDDRLLRFGSVLTDDLIASYVNRIDFQRDKVFGIYNRFFKLVGVGHLAFAPLSERPAIMDATTKASVAEFGVSVTASSRGQGGGSKLFERAAIHCRNADVDIMVMHCLSTNQIIMRIARKAGMEIHRDHSETDAYLKLPPASPGSVMQEAMAEQVASFDYSAKAFWRAAFNWIARKSS